MSVSEMIEYLREVGLVVSVVQNRPYCLHVESRREMPDWVWKIKGWTVSTCGNGRVFLNKMT